MEIESSLSQLVQQGLITVISEGGFLEDGSFGGFWHIEVTEFLSSSTRKAGASQMSPCWRCLEEIVPCRFCGEADGGGHLCWEWTHPPLQTIREPHFWVWTVLTGQGARCGMVGCQPCQKMLKGRPGPLDLTMRTNSRTMGFYFWRFSNGLLHMLE